jgi:hypothetical protein
VADFFQGELTVSLNGDEYVFNIPGIKFEMEVGYRSARIRRGADPEGIGSLAALDGMAANFAYNCALLELYIKAGPRWLFSPGADGKPVVNHEKWPPQNADLVWEVAAAFQNAYTRFRRGGAPDAAPVGGQAVDGGQNPGA